jgi:hypothetical protein
MTKVVCEFCGVEVRKDRMEMHRRMHQIMWA